MKGKAGSFEHNENVTTKEEGETRGLLLGFIGEMIHRDANMSVKQAEVMTEAMTRASTLTSPSTDMGEEYDEVVVKIGRDLAGIARDMSRRGEEEVDAVVSDLLGTPSLAYKMFVRVAARIVEWNETGIVTITASTIKSLLHLCYSLIVRYVVQFGGWSNISSKLVTLISTVSGFLVKMFSQYGVYNWVREHGWMSILPQIPSPGKVVAGLAVGVVTVTLVVGAGYLVYKRIQS